MNVSLVNLEHVSKVAITLIDKVSDAIGGIFKPYQIKRVSKAQSEAKIYEAETEIHINQLQQRALTRFLNEESIKQLNIENVTSKAIPLLKDSAEPDKINSDWLIYFYEKARNISTTIAQDFWAKILAGQANNPDFFSKKTLSVLYELDKDDAILFTKICSCSCKIDGEPHPIIFPKGNYFTEKGLNFDTFLHLENLQLINLSNMGVFGITTKNRFLLEYFNRKLEFEKTKNAMINTDVLFSNVGKQLFNIIEPIQLEDYFDIVKTELVSRDFIPITA